MQYVDHMHGRLSATRLQVAPGADEAETGAPSGAVAEVKAASQKIAFLCFFVSYLTVITEHAKLSP